METAKRSNHQSDQTKNELTFLDHVNELRSRIIQVVLFLAVTTVIAFLNIETLTRLTLRLVPVELVTTTLSGQLSFTLSIALTAGVIATSPVLLFHVISFIAPAVPGTSRNILIRVPFISLFLAVCGCCFAYWIVIPMTIQALLSYQVSGIQMYVTTDSYLGFFVSMVSIFAFAFQFPLIVYISSKLFHIHATFWLRFQSLIIVIISVFIAVITPTTDIISFIVVFIPIVLLYYGSLAMTYFFLPQSGK